MIRLKEKRKIQIDILGLLRDIKNYNKYYVCETCKKRTDNITANRKCFDCYHKMIYENFTTSPINIPLASAKLIEPPVNSHNSKNIPINNKKISGNCEWCGTGYFEDDRNCVSCGGEIKRF